MAYSGNPNWPLMLAELGMQNNPYFSATVPPYADLTGRQYGQVGTRRGAVFELGKPQTGELHGQWTNKDGLLDPGNATGAYAGQLLLFRPYRIRAQWPPTANRLTADQATGGEGTPIAPGLLPNPNGVGIGWTGPSASGGISIVTSASAFQGTQVFQNTMASTALSLAYVFNFSLSVAPNAAYTFSCYVRCLTTGQSPTVDLAANWYTGSGALITTSFGIGQVLTGGSAPAWTQLFVSGTAPSNAAYVLVGPNLASNMSVNTAFQMDAAQWEQAAVSSAFTVPNPWYGVYGGMIERFPQTWNYSGNYGLVSPIGQDSMGPLSQWIMPDQLITNLSSPLGGAAPTFRYNLNEPSNVVRFADATGNRTPAVATDSSFGAGKVSPGSSVTSVTTAGMFLSGNGRTVTNLTAAAHTSGGPNMVGMSGISLPGVPSSGALGPGGGTGLNFTRMIAFRSTNQGTFLGTRTLWAAGYTGATGINGLCIFLNGSFITPALYGSNTQVSLGPLTGANVSNGDWHLLFVSCDGAGNVTFNFDGATCAPSGGTPVMAWAGGFVADTIGMVPNPTGALSNYNYSFDGDVAYFTEWPYAFTSAQYTQVYSAWRNLFAGELSGARYRRILNLAGYQGPVALDAGSTLMGPCDVFNVDAMTALQDVVDTESGRHFVDGNGVLRFHGRLRHYNSTSVAWTFGDANPLGSELPYSNIGFDFDTTYLSNEAQITHKATGQVFQVDDLTSQSNYGIRTLTRTLNAQDTYECQDAANYLVQRYKDPRERLQLVELSTSKNPTVLFPVALGVECGDRVRVNRRPQSAASITVDGFVDQIAHAYDDQGSWTTTLQISPLDALTYGVFASMHTALTATASSGTNTITINALPDAATNVLRANLTAGQQLVLDVGQPTQETVTIAPGGVPVTSLGYTTATLTLTANLGQTHGLGAVVCEPLPPGVTNPAQYDAVAVYGTSHYAY